ncbi:LacI family DNA-binding transcriptional regulator [Lysinibacillus piscis]|uniref:LacI family transcriptional regulator n=1 Tax=Lysinibacillus piscis TaxID=2518931 RepID=A0ABQ5NFF6_9BACI|nr:LacI family DNA-binding transcriptional regulator [Lysinibacillus sp. KH24]GLC87133.1 LacI family transcriptional regulator [Lysinibacillus sp. KH24]
MKPKISDVAKAAGVSPTTVSRVLNNRGYISQETRDNVERAMKEVNYFPNDVARSLFNKRTNLIGIIVPQTSNPFFGELTFHIESICASLHYKVLLCNSLNRVDKEKNYWEMLMRNQVDGVIAVTYNRGLVNGHEKPLPIVTIDHYLSPTIPVVSSDNYAGGVQATELLIAKGCQHILHINGPLKLETPANLRRKGYETVMQQHGRKAITYEVANALDRGEQQKVIAQLFQEHPQVDGIFASDDLVAATVIAEAQKYGKHIPKDLKVIGYDGTETCQTLLPSLTTIRQPIELIAQKAVEVLLKEIEGDYEEGAMDICLPVQLIEGTTT